MKSALFRIGKNDLINGLIMAALTPVIVFLASALQAPGFDFATFDFLMLLKIGLAGGLGYIVKNFFSDQNGKVFGAIG